MCADRNLGGKAWLLRLAFLMPICFGCSTQTWFLPHTKQGAFSDVKLDQPLNVIGSPAFPARISFWTHADNVERFLEWPSGTGDWRDSRDAIRRAQEHLERAGAKRREISMEPELMDLARRTADGHTDRVRSAFTPIWTIVSLEPLIIVESPGTIQSNNLHADPVDLTSNVEGQEALVFLNSGFHYGLHVPYSAEPRWTSPEAGERIYDTREVSPMERAIDHPTRPLRLVREGEFWRVELVQQP